MHWNEMTGEFRVEIKSNATTPGDPGGVRELTAMKCLPKSVPRTAAILSLALLAAGGWLYFHGSTVHPRGQKILFLAAMTMTAPAGSFFWLTSPARRVELTKASRLASIVLLGGGVILCSLPGGHTAILPAVFTVYVLPLLYGLNMLPGLVWTGLLTAGALYADITGQKPGLAASAASIWVVAVCAKLVLVVYDREQESFDRARTSAANLADANVRLQSFAVDLEEFSAGEERFRIARVFHDTLGHCLTAALMQIQASAELIPVAPERAGVKLQLARKMVEEGLGEVKEVIATLRTQYPNRPVGRELWRRLGETFAQCTNMAVEVHIGQDFTEIGQELNETIYHVIQEGLTNAYRHGHATIVDVVVRWRPNIIMVRISDNGHGAGALQEGYGFRGMRERVEKLGGRMAWQSVSGRGFDLGADIPWNGGLKDGEDQSSAGG